MSKKIATKPKSARTKRTTWAWVGVVLVVLVLFFHPSFYPGKILFSSDGPLGANAAEYARLPQAFFGMWQDLNWLGGYVGSAFPSVTYGLLWVLGPYWFAKFYTPISLFLLALSAWFLFRQLRFRPYVCWMGALAAMLNGDFFSYACWGLGTHALAVAATFTSLGILAAPRLQSWGWVRYILAGFAAGMAVIEGFDSGAILTLYIAAAILFHALQESWARQQQTSSQEASEKATPKPWSHAVGLGIVRTAVVALAAGWIATHALTVLIETQVQGVVGMQQNRRTKQMRWDDATQWSLPKIETLRIMIPGLFGYRMDTPDGGNYWGRVGERPGHPEILPRHSGAGPYAGLAVLMAAFWAVVQSFSRRKDPNAPLRPEERRWVYFWFGAALVSLALAWGRHAPFYRLVYALPYFSTIRNPIKFLHPFGVAVVILSAYGLEALWREYAERTADLRAGIRSWLRRWWQQATRLERKWTIGLAVVWAVSLLGWLMYAASKPSLINYLRHAQLPSDLAPKIAAFSIAEVGWYLFFLLLIGGTWLFIVSGVLSGRYRKLGMIFFTLVFLADFYHANRFWVVYWDFDEKYATNDLTRFLSNKPWEHRVTVLPLQLTQQLTLLQQVYHGDWLQHSFRYYNIQALDVVQEPRPSIDNMQYKQAMYGHGVQGLLRMWELTNTKYLIGLGGRWVQVLNDQLDPQRRRFHLAMPFAFEPVPPKNWLTVRSNTAGPFAVLEFADVLPRAKLFSQWTVLTNAQEVLTTLLDTNRFDPHQTVLLQQPIDLTPDTNAAPDSVGSVQIVDYHPKFIRLKVQANCPAVLLLNDKYDPHWRATVDGRPVPILRANYLMRALPIQPGRHTVEMTFRVSSVPLWISVAADACALLLAFLVGIGLPGSKYQRKT